MCASRNATRPTMNARLLSLSSAMSPITDTYYNLIKTLRRQGVPVQGMGMQGHLALQYGLPTTVLQNARRFDSLGIKTAYTEVDVRMQLPADPIKTAAQSEGFGTLLRA